MPKAAATTVIGSAAVEFAQSTTSLLESGCNSSAQGGASLPGKSLITEGSIFGYRSNSGKVATVVPGVAEQREANAAAATNESLSADKQPHSSTRTGSTILLISTKISNPTTAGTKLGAGGGPLGMATIKTTGTLYNIPSPTGMLPECLTGGAGETDDNRKLATIMQEQPVRTGPGEEHDGGACETLSTSKTATILVSKHKTKTGLPLLLKKSKK